MRAGQPLNTDRAEWRPGERMAATHDGARLSLPALPDDPDRPRWSVMIPTYNCAGYLRETLASVLAQAPGPEQMQIEVVDDCSTEDDPESVVRELGQGRVGFYRQPRNVGHVRNFDTCLLRARGRLIHVLHGDDLVRDGFYRTLGRLFDVYPQIGAAFCRHLLMDEGGHWGTVTWLEQRDDGVLERWLERIAVEQRIQAPSIVVRRDVYEHLGGFDRRLTCCGEDWEMWVRIAASYPVAYATEPLAAYRLRAGSLSRRAALTAADTTDLHRVTKIVSDYLPHSVSQVTARRLTREARRTVALSALRIARRQIRAGHLDGAVAQMRAALICSRSGAVVASAMVVAGRLLLRVLADAAWGADSPTLPLLMPGRSAPAGPAGTPS